MSKLVVLGILSVALAAHADVLIDPTRPATLGGKAAPIYGNDSIVHVTAILQAKDRHIAIINGHVVKAGDRLGDLLVQEITAEGVRYARAGRTEFARLPAQAASVRRENAELEAGQ